MNRIEYPLGAKKTCNAVMENASHTWATAALKTFWRRTFSALAVASEKDAKTYRMALKRLGGVS